MDKNFKKISVQKKIKKIEKIVKYEIKYFKKF